MRLSARVAAHAGAGVLERGVGKAVQQVLDVQNDAAQLHVVLLVQRHSTLQHGILHQHADLRHVDGLVDIFIAQQIA